MLRSVAAAALLALVSQAALAAPSLAAPSLDGHWTVDPNATRQSLVKGGEMTPAEVKSVLDMFGTMTLDFTGGAKMTATMAPQSVTCDWAWGDGQRILYSGCVDQDKNPAPGGPDKLELSPDDTILFYQNDGSALTFKRN